MTRYIGRSTPRLEDRPLLSGRGRFAADISFAGQLHMRVVRSPVARGRLLEVDTAAARALAGVAAVWTRINSMSKRPFSAVSWARMSTDAGQWAARLQSPSGAGFPAHPEPAEGYPPK